MPYRTIGELPDSVKNLPKAGQEMYMKVFNAAFKQYDNEGKAHATAWAAVKNKYKKNDSGQWVTKEANMNLSDQQKRNLLQTALVSEYGLKVESPIPKNVSIEEVFDSEIVYAIDGQLYQSSYELGEGGPTFGEPKKVLSTKVFKAMESLSMENRRSLLDVALHNRLGLTKDEYLFIEDMTETEVFYNYNRQAYKAAYSITGDNVITIGDSKKVTRQVVYKAMEALREKYSEIIQEAGRRNASLDSKRIKKIVELCQELLSSDEFNDEKTVEAINEADKTLVWLKEQAVSKVEDGVNYPASAFAYVPDAAEASGWKLRMWEDAEKKVTKNQLRLASASLSKGGLSGIRTAIPAADLAAVKRKIRAEYRKLGVEEADIPAWIKEVETRELLQSFTPLTEAKFDKGRATVIVIKPGFNATEDRYYPAEMLKRDYKIFEGQKMYADHPTEEEDQARPERSIKDWVATLSEVTCDESGVVSGIAEILEPWLMTKLASLRDKQMLSEMGISINAVGSASKDTIDGKETLVIEKLVAARSVDFVTEPGAGGIVTFYESDRGHDIDLVELATLREKRPDLIKAVEAKVRAEITKEVKKAMENEEKITELEGTVATLTTERDALKEAAEKAEKDKATAEAQATIKEAVDKAELPDAAKERLIERYKDAETADGIAEAIQSEVDYIGKLAEAGKVKGMGGSKPDPAKDNEALKESFEKLGLSEEEAKTAAEGR